MRISTRYSESALLPIIEVDGPKDSDEEEKGELPSDLIVDDIFKNQLERLRKMK